MPASTFLLDLGGAGIRIPLSVFVFAILWFPQEAWPIDVGRDGWRPVSEPSSKSASSPTDSMRSCSGMTSSSQGSVTNNKATPTSDLDLIVVVPGDPDVPYRESFHPQGWGKRPLHEADQGSGPRRGAERLGAETVGPDPEDHGIGAGE